MAHLSHALISSYSSFMPPLPQVSLLNDDMPPDIVNPLRMKYNMYCCFVVLVMVSAAMEVRQHVQQSSFLPLPL